MTILTLPEARLFLRGASGVTGGDIDDDAVLQPYVDAVDPVIEDLVGPVSTQSKVIRVDGGRRTVMLPWPVTSVTSVTENGAAVPSDSYTVDAAAGMILRGSPQAVSCWAPGTLNIEVTAIVGRDPLPANIKLAAQELLKHLWTSRQGPRPSVGGRVNSDTAFVQTTWTPSGFAVPHKVAELLAATPRLPGIA